MRNNKKGSSTILLVMILSSMILLVFALVQIAIQVSGGSVGQSILQLSGRSILSEYDQNLKKEYGILAFRGQSNELASKMAYYAEPFFSGNPYHKLSSIEIKTADQRLSDPTIFEKAIKDYIAYAIAKGIIKEFTSDDFLSTGQTTHQENINQNRCLRNQRIIESLPSYQMGEPPGMLQKIKNNITQLDHALEKGTDNYLVNLYIMSQFKSAQNDIQTRNTFFNNEIEYILKGGLEDERNRKTVRNDLLLLRNAINIGYIYTNNIMRTQVIAAANLITPGPEAELTQAFIAEAWALAEAENDVKILEHDKKLPIYKSERSWAIDLQSIIENKEVDYIDIKSTSGLDYQGYMQIFLFFEDRNTKLFRMMDLIQINIQGKHDKSFLIQDHQVGLIYETTINHSKIQGKTNY